MYIIMSFISTSSSALEINSSANSIKLNGAPGFKQILFGSGSISKDNGASTGVHITFSQSFENVPTVVATAASNGNNYQVRHVGVQNISTTGFDVYGLYHDYNNGINLYGVSFTWIAIG
jgi:H-type lectin domain